VPASNSNTAVQQDCLALRMPKGIHSFNPLTQFCSSVPTLPTKNSKLKNKVMDPNRGTNEKVSNIVLPYSTFVEASYHGI